MPFPGKDLELQIIERPGDSGETLAYLRITNRASVPLKNNWRLYFSLGLEPTLSEHRVRQVTIDGRYGYLEPDDWAPLPPDSSIEIPINNWLLNRMPARARQGFHFTEGDDLEEVAIPTVLPPALLPMQSVENTGIKDLSPSCDIELQTPEHIWQKNQRGQSEAAGLRLIPNVKAFETSGTSVACSGFDFDHEELGKVLRRQTDGLPVRVSINSELDVDCYKLTVTDEDINIDAGSNRAVFYSAHTLRQLIQADGSLPTCSIEDKPDFDHRGLFLDLARHFQPAEEIKRIIRVITAYKMNRLQLGISNDEGWRLQIPGLPEMTETGARRTFHANDQDGNPCGLYPAWGDGPEEQHEYLTTEEFTELLTFAATHHVEIVVEFNLPAHANALIRAMAGSGRFRVVDPLDESVHRSAQGYTNNVVNVCMPDTYVLSAKILTAIHDCYKTAAVPFKHVHLGGDEVPEGAWLHSPACRNSECWDSSWDVSREEDRKAAEATLLRHYAGEILTIVKELSPKTQAGFWHEMSPALPATDNIYITGWATEGADHELITDVLARDQQLVIANASFLYLDMPYGLHVEEPGLPWAAYIDTQRIHDFDPLACWQIPDGERPLVKGIQAQLWSETVTGPQMMDYYLFPRLLAVADRAWQIRAETKAWMKFAQALGGRELSYLDSLGVEYRLPPPGAKVIDGKLHANVAFPGLVIRYTKDGTDPDANAEIYLVPLELTNIEEIRMATFSKTRDTSSRIITISTDTP
ncbi:MAG: family 20 glycosylhydrolase [Gammaproteobacteria bacterium]|jgi:hexosaminidase|nr:family 20 glycosylhydrolase [Gammaproteobacteria bacterium]